jgi:hypothetical protein
VCELLIERLEHQGRPVSLEHIVVALAKKRLTRKLKFQQARGRLIATMSAVQWWKAPAQLRGAAAATGAGAGEAAKGAPSAASVVQALQGLKSRPVRLSAARIGVDGGGERPSSGAIVPPTPGGTRGTKAVRYASVDLSAKASPIGEAPRRPFSPLVVRDISAEGGGLDGAKEEKKEERKDQDRDHDGDANAKSGGVVAGAGVAVAAVEPRPEVVTLGTSTAIVTAAAAFTTTVVSAVPRTSASDGAGGAHAYKELRLPMSLRSLSEESTHHQPGPRMAHVMSIAYGTSPRGAVSLPHRAVSRCLVSAVVASLRRCHHRRGVAVLLARTYAGEESDSPKEPPPYVSPLSLAVHRKHRDVCRLLVKHNIDPTVTEDFGESAYGLALVELSVAAEQVSKAEMYRPDGSSEQSEASRSWHLVQAAAHVESEGAALLWCSLGGVRACAGSGDAMAGPIGADTLRAWLWQVGCCRRHSRLRSGGWRRWR